MFGTSIRDVSKLKGVYCVKAVYKRGVWGGALSQRWNHSYYLIVERHDKDSYFNSNPEVLLVWSDGPKFVGDTIENKK